ncbi:MAG: UDP-2,3-diacylglucosamine diphosphatase [bacterium]
MPERSATIVSDLHIGSPYFLREPFLCFLERIPPSHELILNGDVIDDPRRPLGLQDQRVLRRLREESRQRRVIWIRGNHDGRYTLENPGEIEFAAVCDLGKRLLVAHGDDFDQVMPRSLAFMMVMKALHGVRVRMGAPPVHVAQWAKKWGRLYRVLRENVMRNAVRYARENGYEAVTCGHAHFAEDRMLDGIRYINTGSWTETPLFYLVAEQEISLRSLDLPMEVLPARELPRRIAQHQTRAG